LILLEGDMTGKSGNLSNVSKSAKLNIYEHVYKVLTVSAFLLLALGTVVYHFLEDWSWVDSLYFSVVAVTTVGFGDLSPSTDGSKLFTVVYILLGITVITTYLNNRFKYRAYEALQDDVATNDADHPDEGSRS
jgi:hypothetical protein